MEKILILEDNADAGEVMTTILKSTKRQVILCRDSVTAFLTDKNYERDISLVIFDINLPKDDGITVVEYMKRINPFQKFLCVSGQTEQHRKRLDELNIDEVLSKPFMANELLFAVDKLIGKKE